MNFRPSENATIVPFRGLWTPRNRKWISWLGILTSIALVLILGQGKVTEEMNRPLAPTLAPAITVTSTVPTADASLGLEATQNEPASQPQCGGPRQMLILAAGIDRHSIDKDRTGLVDVIRIVRIDFVKADVRILAIPRDLWVLIPGLEGRTKPEGYFGYPIVDGEVLELPGDHGRINASYFYGELYDLPGGGPGILARTLYQNFGLAAEHYAIADMQTFADAIDAIGGIDLYVAERLGSFTSGWHHMDGQTALEYSRIRKPDTDWDRIDRQSQVLLALGEQALAPENLASLPGLANSFLDNLLTDLSKSQITSITCLASKLSRDTITTYRIGPEMVTSVSTTYKASVMLPKMEQIRILVADFLNEENILDIPDSG